MLFCVRALTTLKAMGPGMERRKSYGRQALSLKTMEEIHMKINLFDLQIFAEPNGNSEPNGNNIEPNTGASGTAVTEPNKDNKPQPKYTEEDLDRIIQEKKKVG